MNAPIGYAKILHTQPLNTMSWEELNALHRGNLIEKIYKEYNNKLVTSGRIKYNISTDLAEDCFQETALVILNNGVTKFSERSSFSTWLYSIYKHKILDFLRSPGNKRLDYYNPLPCQQNTYNPLLHAKADESTNADTMAVFEDVRRLLAKLKPLQEEAFYLFYIEGRNTLEIAQMLNTSEGTIKSRLFYARKNL